MQQAVDLQSHEDFRLLGIELLSISPDPLDSWESEAKEYGIELPVLSDPANEVATDYGVMEWAVGSEPGTHSYSSMSPAK